MKKKIRTRRQRIASQRRISKKAQGLVNNFEREMFIMHSAWREYDDSHAAKALLQLGKAAMHSVAIKLQGTYAGQFTGTPGSSHGFWHQFSMWTMLVNDMLRRAGRQSPYSSKTPYINMDIRVYVQALLDCAKGKVQAPQIHDPNFIQGAPRSRAAA